MPVTHLFVSALPDGADATLVRPSNWNEAHVVSIENADVAAGAGIVESKLALNFPTHAAVTIGTASGLSLVAQVLSLGLASSGVTGALSGTDWDTFNNKQSTLTFPLASTLGGTGVNNAGTLTNASNTTITGGGTLALGGFTLTVPATGTAALLAADNAFTGTNTFTRGTDSSNTFIGNAGNNTATGTLNTAVGTGALDNLTNGIGNVALGNQALTSLNSGQANFGLGKNSLLNLTGGSNNVAIGESAMAQITTGSDNVAIGGNAFSVRTAWAGIAIGYNAGAKSTSTAYQLFIDATLNPRTNETVERENSFLYGLMTTNGFLQLNIPTTTNNAVLNTLKLQAYISTASTGAANGFGVGLPFFAETATDGTYQQQGLISTSWIDATNATRKAKMSLSAYDTAARLGIEIEASGTVPMLGFYGVAPVARATNAIAAGAFVANTSGIVNDTATFGGYTIGQIVQALQNIGILT